MSNYELWCRVSIPNGPFLCICWRDKWGKNRGDGCPANTRGAHMYIYTHWKGKTSRRWWQWGISLPLSASSPLALLSSPPSFEAPGIFPGSLLQPVYNRQQRASEERGSGGGAKQDFVLIPSFFPPHSYRDPVAAPMRLGCQEEAKESQIRCCPLHTD